jgi:RHS repeat-associated protein
VDKNSGGTVVNTKTYYPAVGAMRVGSTLYYMLKDHLSSASVVSDASGTIVGEDRFTPFGETRFTTGTMLTDKLYTGQREMAGLGIYHYQARFYSPKLGRFLSADTIVPGYANPQAFNRYSYVLNNPVKLTDPTGHQCSGEPEECFEDDGTMGPGFPGTGGGGGSDDGGGDSGGGGSDDDDDGGDLDYCDTHPGSCGLPPTQPPIILEPTPAEGGASDYYCFSHRYACGGGTPTTSSEEPCRDCALEVALGFLAFLEGAVFAGAGLVLLVASFSAGPIFLISAPFFLAGIAVGVNWIGVGVQEINAGSHPDEHHEIDYLPLVHFFFPDALRNRR